MTKRVLSWECKSGSQLNISKFYNINIYKEGNPVIGYLKQIEFEDDNITMLDEILKVYKPIIDLEEKINRLVEKMQNDTSEDLVQEYSKANERWA